MEIKNRLTPAVEVAFPPARAAPRNWQQGQLLLATVLKTAEQSLLLRIDGTDYRAASAAKLTPGQTLTLQVSDAQADPPVLRLVTPALQRAPVADLIRVLLPRQTSLTPLLANLTLLARPPAALANALPAPVLAQAQSIQRSLPDVSQVSSADGLKRALRDSGLFVEHRLAQEALGGPRAELGTDLRAGLLRLVALLQAARPATPAAPTASRNATLAQPTPGVLVRLDGADIPPPLRGTQPQPQGAASATLAAPDSAARITDALLGQADGALARIETHQLQSLSSDTQQRPLWLLELPVRSEHGTDLFHLRIAEEEHDSRRGAPSWAVTLAFDLSGLGPIRARLALLGGQMSITFWAEQDATRTLFQTHLDTLHQRLAQAGVPVGRLGCVRGTPPPAPGGDSASIVDETA